MTFKFKPRRTIDREAVAKSLRELELLFGKIPPETKGNPTFARGAGEAAKLTKEKI